MASRSDRTRSHGNDGKLRKNSNPVAGSEFIQRYSKEEYSRAIPTSAVPKAKPRLGEYCVPVDSKPVQKQKSVDRLEFPQDPDHGYALPQDSLIGSSSSSASQNEEVDGLVYELAQSPQQQDYHSPPPAKPLPLPRSSLKENEKSPQHNSSSKSVCQQPKITEDASSSTLSEYNLASACFNENPEVTTSERKRPSKKVVEIEYEAVSDLRPYRPTGGQPLQKTSSLEKPDQTTSMSSLNALPTDPPPNLPLSGPPLATSGPLHNVQQETLYEEPWDLKAKRLKDEQDKKEKERKLSLVRTESKNVPDMRSDVYEEAWDTAAQQRKLEQKFKLGRTLSQTSEQGDVYHDAFESLPESKMQLESKKESHHQKSSPAKHDSVMRQQSNSSHATNHNRYSQSKSDKLPQPPGYPPPDVPPPLAPLPTDTYEDAWDLKNVILEEKIRKMQMQASVSYEEPWEISKKHKDLQAQFNRSQSAFTEKTVAGVPRSSSDAREHTANAANATRAYLKGRHNSTDDARLKYKSRGPKIGQRINPLIPLSHQNWFHGNVSRDDAEQMLCVCKEGSYIVRISSDRKSYSLSIKSAKQYIHVQIEQVVQPDGTVRFILGKNSKEFCTIPEMIDHYTHHRVPLKGAEHITLLHPVECKWSQQSQ